MFFDDEPGPIFRPPSEAHSFILRVTVGCSHNKCTYCNMYKSVRFHIKTPEEILAQIKAAASMGIPVRRVFLSDGDALVLPIKTLLDILQQLRDTFPKLQRVSAYAGPRAILLKKPEELVLLRENGLKLLYYGMETGDDKLLAKVKKGVNAQEAIDAGVRVREAGMKLSIMIILGLAGRDGTKEHAQYTAEAINIIKPDMLSALTLMLHRGSELKEEYDRGEFPILNPAELLGELYDILQQVELPKDVHTIFRSNHVSNYISLAGTLPKDKEDLLGNVLRAKEQLGEMTSFDPYNNTYF